MIHICYTFQDRDGRYSKFVGTSMLSVFENTDKKVTIHILHDKTLTDSNHDKFKYIADQYQQKINFYNIETTFAENMRKIKENFSEKILRSFSISIVYRLLIPEIISKDIDKIIYLDSDTIINLDIADLWNTQIKDYPIAAVPEIANNIAFIQDKIFINKKIIPPENYFNSGVLYINLTYWRKHEDIFDKAFKFLEKNPDLFSYPDQDFLNYCFGLNLKILPVQFNSFINAERFFLKAEKTEKKIYHYVGGSFGFGLQFDSNDIFNQRIVLNKYRPYSFL